MFLLYASQRVKGRNPIAMTPTAGSTTTKQAAPSFSHEKKDTAVLLIYYNRITELPGLNAFFSGIFGAYTGIGVIRFLVGRSPPSVPTATASRLTAADLCNDDDDDEGAARTARSPAASPPEEGEPVGATRGGEKRSSPPCGGAPLGVKPPVLPLPLGTALRGAKLVGVAIGEGATNDDDDEDDDDDEGAGVGEDATIPQGTGAMRCFFFLAVSTCIVLPAVAFAGAGAAPKVVPAVVVPAGEAVAERACAVPGALLESPSTAIMAAGTAAAVVEAPVAAAPVATVVLRAAALLVEAAAAAVAGVGLGLGGMAWAWRDFGSHDSTALRSWQMPSSASLK